MIGEMFESEGDNQPVQLDFEELDIFDLEYGGDNLAGSYMCVGKILSSVDIYDSHNKIDIDSCDHIRKSVETILQKAFPGRNLNMGMYHITDLS